MANTFLNTSRTLAASSNPQTNVQQVSNNVVPNVQQPTPTPAVSQAQQSNTNGISPITIPIQIQPVTPTQGIAPVSNNNIQSLQTVSNANQNEVSSAPTPQTYNPENTNNNIVDFNQIYESYQSQYGNNQNVNNNVSSSGVKRTSVGTTIVTPKTSNLNSIEGQYQSAYSDTMNSLLQKMLEGLDSIENGTFYDPTQDKALQAATEYAANSTLQSLAGSGVLNSSATAERVARVVSELIPQYENLAYDRKMAYLGQLANTAQMVQSYDAQQFEYWKDAKDREFQERQFEFNKKQQELENAWKRVDELGYVDNDAAAILGVKAGTLSGEARLAKEQREFELQKMKEQAQLEYQNNKALYELRSQLDKEYADYEYKLKQKNTEYEYQLQQKYSTVSSSKTSSGASNFDFYDKIIQNRFAPYNEITKQYTVTDEETYNKLGDYLDQLLASGLITEAEFASLTAKYSTYSGYSNSTSGNVNSINNSGLNDSNVDTWRKALDGNNSALKELGITIWGQTKSNVNNSDAKKAVKEALKQIKEGTYTFTTNQQLMNDLKNHRFGHLGWGF